MKTKARKTAVFVSLLMIIVLGTLSAQVPKSVSDIPALPGALRDKAKEAEGLEQMGWQNDPSLRSYVYQIWMTAKPLEDVFNFYRQKIGGKEGVPEQNPYGMAAGTSSAVFFELEYYSDEDFENAAASAAEGGNSGLLKTWMKDGLVKNRKPLPSGQWLKEVRFNWVRKEPNSDFTTFYLILHDGSFDSDSAPGTYKASTEIQVQVTTATS